jgi:hypothetical protein
VFGLRSLSGPEYTGGHLGAAEAVLDALVYPEGPVYYAV